MSCKLVITITVAPLSFTCKILLSTCDKFSSSITRNITKKHKIKTYKLTSSFFIFIKHGKWSMSELSTWVTLSMNAGNLTEFLGCEFTDIKSSSLCQYKDIILPFQKLSDIFVFLNVGWLERVLQAE